MTGRTPPQPDASDIEALDRAAPEGFNAAVSPLFEGAPAFLARLAGARPFGSWAALFEAARRIAQEMPEAEQVQLVDAHPRLGAPPGSVSALSFVEQGYDREEVANLALERERERRRIAAELDDLNAQYEASFGFRYCVFVAGRSRAGLIPEMAAALGRERESELRRALHAVVDIAIDRHRKSGTVSP